jgi:hypothetical protein
MSENANASGATGSATGSTGQPHPGELALRRYLAGEPPAAERDRLAAHAASCAACTRRIEGLVDEQRAFEERISFDRFAAGVERAARVPAATPVAAGSGGRRLLGRPASTRSFFTAMSVGALAAGLALYIGAKPLFQARQAESDADARPAAGTNNIKGATGLTVLVAGAAGGPQRAAVADVPEALAFGELVRIGVKSGGRRFLFVVSIDDRGTVTALYPEAGTSMVLPRTNAIWYLPESVEFTGKGTERLVAVLSDVPLELDGIKRAVAAAFPKAGGNVARLPPLALPGEQFHRTFLKP